MCGRDRWRCYYCNRAIKCQKCENPTRRGRVATRDHLVPIVAGGTDALANQVGACLQCNLAKGDMSVEEFFASGLIDKPPTRYSGDLSRRELAQRLVVPVHVLDSLDIDAIGVPDPVS